MYLKTKRQYQKGGGGRRRSISRRVLVLANLAGVGILLAYFVLKHQEPIRGKIESLIASAEDRFATISAPTPTPAADPRLCLSRANAAYEAGKLLNALEYYECAAQGMPNDVDVHTQLAFLLTVNGRAEEGFEAAKHAILADPTAPDGYAIAGMALDWVASETEQRELYGRAMAYVLRALDIDENHADAYAFMSEIYTDQGRIEDAYRTAEKALELDPENFKAYRNYGYALQTQGYYEDAAAAFEQAIRLNPKLPHMRIQLAQMYLNLGRTTDATDLLLQAVQLTGGDPESYYWLGHTYLVYQGDFPAARSTWETCVDVDPDHRGCWTRLANLLLFLQEYDLAGNAYDRAIDLGSKDPDVYYYAAYIDQLNGHCDRAISDVRRGLELENLTPQEEQDLREILNECRAGPGPLGDEEANEGDEDG